ncbi:hypothetical protein ACLB1N_34300 [Escherichia coli]
MIVATYTRAIYSDKPLVDHQAVPSDTEDRAFLLEQAKQQAASMRAEANRKAPRKEWD